MASSDEAPVARLADTLCGRFDGETESLSGSGPRRRGAAQPRRRADRPAAPARGVAPAERPAARAGLGGHEDAPLATARARVHRVGDPAVLHGRAGLHGVDGEDLGGQGGLKRKQHRNQVARDLIARLDDCYLKVESIADASSTSPHRRAPPSFEDVGTFPFKLHAPDGDEYPLKAPKPYMELYGDRWWFVKLFAHPQVVTRLLRQLWPHLFVVALFQLGINALTALNVDPPVSVLRELEATQHLLGAVLSLLLVFRTNSAYERYYDGKKQYGIIANQVRQIIMNAYAFISFHEDPTGRLRQRYGRGLELDDEHEAESLHELRERVRRQAIVLFAVLRQGSARAPVRLRAVLYLKTRALHAAHVDPGPVAAAARRLIDAARDRGLWEGVVRVAGHARVPQFDGCFAEIGAAHRPGQAVHGRVHAECARPHRRREVLPTPDCRHAAALHLYLNSGRAALHLRLLLPVYLLVRDRAEIKQ